MIIPLLGIIAGILVAYAGIDYFYGLSLIIVSAILYILTIIGSRGNPIKEYKLAPLHTIWIFLIFAGSAVISYDLQRPWNDDYIASKSQNIRLHIHDIHTSEYGDRAYADVSDIYTSTGKHVRPTNLRIILNADIIKYNIDDFLLVTSHLSPIHENANYFPSGYENAIHRKGINYEIHATEHDITYESHSPTLSGLSKRFRTKLETIIEYSGLDIPTQHFLIVILLGDRDFLNPDIQSGFSDAGISHMLALSGMHMTIIAGILLFILFPINFLGYYKFRLIVAMVLLSFYTFVTGCAPSTLRALIMMACMTFSIILERKNSALNSLIIAATIILFFDPKSLFDIGFQLSFLCVASLILFTNKFNPIDHRRHPNTYKIFSFLLVSIIASLSTMVLSAYGFGKIPMAFLFANIPIIPLLPYYLSISIMYISLTYFGIDISYLADILNNAYHYLLEYISILNAHLPSITFSPGIISVALWIVFLSFAALYANRRTIPNMVLTISSFLISAVSMYHDYKPMQDAFVIRKSISHETILVRESGRESEIRFTPHTISKYRVAGKTIIFIGAPTATLNHQISCDIAYISSGVNEDITEILSNVKAKEIVLSSKLKRKQTQKMWQSADSLGMKCHNIIESGPYRYIP